MQTEQITWAQRVKALKEKLGRRPALDELLEEAKKHTMTKEEKDQQRESMSRANVSTGDPRFD